MTSPRTLLKAWDMHAKKQLGQNFLTDPSTTEMIVSRSKISGKDVVVEIGPGLGALTIPVSRVAKTVYAIEKDTHLLPLLESELLAAGVDNVQIINADVMKVDVRTFAEDKKIVVMGNLPYNISSQILVRLMGVRAHVSRAVFMFQRELAQRIAAPPGSKEYGRLSVALQYCAHIRTVAQVNSEQFYPRPKVDSDVIEIRFREAIEDPAHDEDLLLDVIKAAFSKRRKTLKNALSTSELKFGGDFILKALECSGIDPVRRAETLSVKEFTCLTNCMDDLRKEG